MSNANLVAQQERSLLKQYERQNTISTQRAKGEGKMKTLELDHYERGKTFWLRKQGRKGERWSRWHKVNPATSLDQNSLWKNTELHTLYSARALTATKSISLSSSQTHHTQRYWVMTSGSCYCAHLSHCRTYSRNWNNSYPYLVRFQWPQIFLTATIYCSYVYQAIFLIYIQHTNKFHPVDCLRIQIHKIINMRLNAGIGYSDQNHIIES